MQNIKRILLVDDEPLVRKPMAMALQMDRYQTTEAATAEEALSLYRPGLYDLVITDFSLPKMRGDELATAIRNLDPNQSIILITAWAEHLKAHGAATDCFNRVLSKPISVSDFRAQIAEVLGQSAKPAPAPVAATESR